MKIISSINKKNFKWWLNIGLCAILFVFIGTYTFNETKNVLMGVNVKANIEKTDNSSIVNIVGNAKNASLLTLNGREISIDKNGNFNEKVTLLPGLSVITVFAEDNFGKSSEKNFEIVYKENNQVALISK